MAVESQPCQKFYQQNEVGVNGKEKSFSSLFILLKVNTGSTSELLKVFQFSLSKGFFVFYYLAKEGLPLFKELGH